MKNAYHLKIKIIKWIFFYELILLKQDFLLRKNNLLMNSASKICSEYDLTCKVLLSGKEKFLLGFIAIRLHLNAFASVIHFLPFEYSQQQLNNERKTSQN